MVRNPMVEFEKTGDRNPLYLEAAGYVIWSRVFEKGAPDFWGAREIDNKGTIWYGYPLKVNLR